MTVKIRQHYNGSYHSFTDEPPMPNPDLSILLVSDGHLVSSAFGSSLQRAGYQDIRQANDAVLALEQIDQRAASVVVCAGEAGLKLAEKVRQRDEMNDHYTYMLLISAEPPLSLLDDASHNDIDDLIAPEDLERLLLTGCWPPTVNPARSSGCARKTACCARTSPASNSATSSTP